MVLHQLDQVGAAGDEGELGIKSMGCDRFRGIISSPKRKWMHASAPRDCCRDGVDDVGIAGAATEISAHALSNFCARQIRQSKGVPQIRRGSAWPAGLGLLDHGDPGHNLARRAETALESVV